MRTPPDVAQLQQTLRPHQLAALAQVLQTWETSANALVVMPCGTGKTMLAAAAAEAVDAELVAVFVPTLALLRQTIRSWREHLGDRLGSVFAVGSHNGLVEDGLTEHAATTDPDLLAILLARRTGTVTLVVSTYHSAGVLAEAQRRSREVPVFDLVMHDEAHHLAGSGGGRFAAVWDVVATRRCSLTATPTATGDAEGSFIPVAGRNGHAVSMDDESVFGPLAYRLTMADARAAALLTDWRVVVRASSAGADQHHGHSDPIAGACEVLLTTAMEMGLRSVLVYTNRVRDALRLTAMLTQHGTLADGTPVVADVVVAATPGDRRAVLLNTLQQRDAVRVVVNVDCLAEGVDVPSLDAVMFTNGRTSRVAITQIIGRVTRPAANKTVGVVLLPVPVDLTEHPDGADPDAVLRSGRMGMVWATCRALRDVDERFAAALQDAARRRAHRTCPPPELNGWVFDMPERLASAVTVACVDAVTDTWWRWFGRVEAAASIGAVLDTASDPALRSWCAAQRRARARGVLAAEKAAALDAVPGWCWVSGFHLAADSIRALLEQWPADGIDLRNGALMRVPGWPRSAGVLAAWARVARRRGRLDGALAAALGALPGWEWNLVDATDAVEVDALDRFRAWEGHCDVPAGHVEHAVDLGAAVSRWRQRRAAGTLPVALADEITAAASGRFRWRTTEVRWSAFLDELRTWCATHGHARRIGDVVCDTASGRLHLGQWVSRVRFEYRHGTLDQRWITELASVPGWTWDAQAPRVGIDLGDAQHGTRSGYVRGCRCAQCTASNNEYRMERAGRAPADRCDAAEAAAHLERLTSAGVSLRHVGHLLGLSRSTLQKLSRDGRGYVSKKTATSLAGADPEALFTEIVGRARVDEEWATVLIPSGPTMQRLAELIAAGWPKSWIARECGLGNALQLHAPRVRAGSAARVLALCEAVAGMSPPSRTWRQPLPTLDAIRIARGGAPG